jgi:hypothetical protein
MHDNHGMHRLAKRACVIAPMTRARTASKPTKPTGKQHYPGMLLWYAACKYRSKAIAKSEAQECEGLQKQQKPMQAPWRGHNEAAKLALSVL